MLLSFEWLKQFAELPKGFGASDVADWLGKSTAEVESVSPLGQLLDKIVVGRVTALRPHPNADRLRVVDVDLGSEQATVVCGGTNLRDGMLVAFAQVGARVRWHGEGDLITLTAATIRGVESAGMICASDEIGIADVVPCADGAIADLSDRQCDVGAPLAVALGLSDVILELDNKTLSNRPDLWGHVGIARELAAGFHVPFTPPAPPAIRAGRGESLSVAIADTSICRRYLGVVVSGLKTEPSPTWLASRLQSLGVRPINLIVDITNYVMLELGQPLHAFDWREIQGDKIIIREAKAGEQIVTLDGVQRTLPDGGALICDAKRPLAIAGIMGGEGSSVADDTTTVMFEAATFDPGTIRRASMSLGLRTESSARFEKGLDPLLAETALRRVVQLVRELCPTARVVSKVVDEFPVPIEPPTIPLILSWLNRRLGTPVEPAQVADILTRLGCRVKRGKKAEELLVTVPSWRATGDLERAEDLLEEVARLTGYDTIPSAQPLVVLTPPVVEPERKLVRAATRCLAGLGYTELRSYAFTNTEEVTRFGLQPEHHLRIQNPLSETGDLLRSDLVPGLLAKYVENQRFYDDIRLFEYGRVFALIDGEDIRKTNGDERLPWQHRFLGGVMTLPDTSDALRTLRSQVEALAAAVGRSVTSGVVETPPPFSQPGRTAAIMSGKTCLGFYGELQRSVAAAAGATGVVGWFEIDLDTLTGQPAVDHRYQPVTKYPVVVRDIAIGVPIAVTWQTLAAAVETAAGELFRGVELFDVFEGGTLAGGERSLAFHLSLSAPDRTLTTAEVDAVVERVTTALAKHHQARVR